MGLTALGSRSGRLVVFLVIGLASPAAAKRLSWRSLLRQVQVRPERVQAWKKHLLFKSAADGSVQRSPVGFQHQGGANEFPPNSMAGFKDATARNHALDCDVTCTKDGTPVLHHDDNPGRQTIDRTGRNRPVEQTGWETLRSDVKIKDPKGGQPHELVRLEDLLATTAGQPICIEVKNVEAARVVARHVKANPQLKQRAIFGSFSSEAVRLLRRELGADAMLGMNMRDGLKLIALAQIPILRRLVRLKTDADFVGMPVSLGEIGSMRRLPKFLRDRELVTPALVRTAHRAGVLVYAWTENSEAGIKKLVKNGADGVFSNSPSALSAVLGSDRGW